MPKGNKAPNANDKADAGIRKVNKDMSKHVAKPTDSRAAAAAKGIAGRNDAKNMAKAQAKKSATPERATAQVTSKKGFANMPNWKTLSKKDGVFKTK